MVSARLALSALLVASTAIACAGDDAASGTDSEASAGTGDSADSNDSGDSGDGSLAQTCVDTINDYRATLDLPPYERWTDAEPCTDSQAEKDAKSGAAHGAFGECEEWAQNECPGWPSEDPKASLLGCLEQMWAEGPGEDFGAHGHYINMSSTSYTKVSCGFHTNAGGDLWAIQNFR